MKDLLHLLAHIKSGVLIFCFNPIALRKAKIVYNFGLSECNRVKCEELLHCKYHIENSKNRGK